MATSIFDPIAYLQHLDPGIAYTCKTLTGGIVNTTIRATKQNTAVATPQGKFAGHASFILKHAPPYIAGVGEAAPMTQYRQTIEANALSLFSPKAAPSLSSVCLDSGVNVPTLLHHDTKQHVLVLSDLGTLPNLSDIFALLGGQAPGPQTTHEISHTIFSNPSPTLSDTQTSFFSSIGVRLGTFFATLHSRTTYTKVLWQHRLEHFQIPEIQEMVLNHAIKPVRDQLKLFPDLLTADEADHIGDLLITDFQRDTSDDERSFVLGDSWTGAVLVDTSTIEETVGVSDPTPTPTPTGAPRSSVSVIDWEFATFARGLHGDIAQFLAHLEVLRITARQGSRSNPNSKSDAGAGAGSRDDTFTQQHQALTTLISSFIKTYTDTASLASEDLSTPVLTSAIFSHAAEMVQIAFWKRWTCVDHQCAVHGTALEDDDVPAAITTPRNDGRRSTSRNSDDDAATLKTQPEMTLNARCPLIRRIVQEALWWFRIGVRLNQAVEESDDVAVAALVLEVGARVVRFEGDGEDYGGEESGDDGRRADRGYGHGFGYGFADDKARRDEDGDSDEEDLLEFGNIGTKNNPQKAGIATESRSAMYAEQPFERTSKRSSGMQLEVNAKTATTDPEQDHASAKDNDKSDGKEDHNETKALLDLFQSISTHAYEEQQQQQQRDSDYDYDDW